MNNDFKEILTRGEMMLLAKSYRESARSRERDAQESFDRCDTDGFVSQWSSDLNARELLAKADILEVGGVAEFPALVEKESGRELDAKCIKGQFGWVWILEDIEIEKFGRRFIPTGDNSRIQKSFGLEERGVLRPAWAKLSGSGTGLAGAMTVSVTTFERDFPLNLKLPEGVVYGIRYEYEEELKLGKVKTKFGMKVFKTKEERDEKFKEIVADGKANALPICGIDKFTCIEEEDEIYYDDESLAPTS